VIRPPFSFQSAPVGPPGIAHLTSGHPALGWGNEGAKKEKTRDRSPIPPALIISSHTTAFFEGSNFLRVGTIRRRFKGLPGAGDQPRRALMVTMSAGRSRAGLLGSGVII
jgi:hypothetical protein